MDGDKSDTDSKEGSITDEHIWKKACVFTFKGKQGGTQTFKYELYIFAGLPKNSKAGRRRRDSEEDKY